MAHHQDLYCSSPDSSSSAFHLLFTKLAHEENRRSLIEISCAKQLLCFFIFFLFFNVETDHHGIFVSKFSYLFIMKRCIATLDLKTDQ